MNNRARIKILEDDRFVVKRLLNSHIDIYDIEYRDNGNIYTIDSKDLDSIPFEVEVVTYGGIRGYLNYMKGHKDFIISVLISIGMMIFLSNVVVNVNIIHNDKKIRELLEEELYNRGIHPFMIKKSFKSLQDIKEQIRENYPEDIEWLEIIDDGMKYVVRVEERIITKEEIEPPFCDIESDKEAVIISSKIRSGQALVDQGDAVKKGSILISGTIKFNEATKSFVCADATVYGNTWYTLNISVPYEYVDKDYTGKTHKNISFEFGSKRTPIFKVHFDEYDTTRKKIFSIGRLTIYSEIDREYISEKRKYTIEEAKEIALKKARDKLLTNLDKSAEILDEKVLQTHEYDSIIEMDIFYSVKEIISKQVEKEIPENKVEGEEDEIT